MIEFGTWYQINCESEDEWREDFGRIRHAGFDVVVLWHMTLPVVDKSAPDVRLIVSEAEQTQRALDEAARAGLTAYLGIWHPYCMGNVRHAWRPQWSDGRPGGGPDIFNEGWLHSAWQPYVQAAGRLCAEAACRGVFLDDTFPATPGNLKAYLSYAPAVRRRFQSWLAGRYGSVANLNMVHQLTPGFRSFSEARLPGDPLENLPLWTDWMEARDEWCREYIATARRALDDGAAIGRRLELVLSDRDYHIQCTPLQYGVEYAHLMPCVDRLETYMAAEHTKVGAADLIRNVRRIVRRGVRVANGKPFLFHTWFADLVTLQPMDPALLGHVMEAAAEEGAAGIEVYTFKVHDWRQTAQSAREARRRPALPEASLKYNPDLLAAIARTIRRLGGHG